MGFDPRTLFLVHGLIALTLGGMVFAFWRAHRTMSCLALWSGGLVLLGTGTLFITLRGAVPDLVSVVVANSLSVSGAIVVWNGIRVFNARRPRWAAALVALPLLAVALAYWTYAENDLAIRIIIVNGTLAVVSFMCVYELLRLGQKPSSRIALVAGAPLLLDGIALTARALLAPLHSPTPSLMTAGGSTLLVVPLVGNVLTAFGFIVMTAERYIQERCELEAQLFRSQKMEALGTLAGGIAHDLNNTLVPLLALAKTTGARLPDGSRERNNLRTIFRASERARDLVGQILAFSRKEAPVLESVDLAQVTRESLTLLRAGLPSTIGIEEKIEAVPPLMGDGGKLHQVVTNLVTNAAQAIGDRFGTITIEVLPAPGPAIRLSVSDTGCGMNKAIRQRIFEPFFTTKKTGQGTGLGLAVVHGIVALHGGRIEVASAPGQGTRFDIELPAGEDEVISNPVVAAASSSKSAGTLADELGAWRA